MVIRLSYRERVVLSIIMMMWLVSTRPLNAQPSIQATPVTITCHDVSLETAFEKLSQKAGVYFVYSPSVLDLNKKVSFNVQGQPLNRLLDHLAEEANLSFRYEGKYVIVKKGEYITKKAEPKVTTFASPPVALASSHSLMDKVSQQQHLEHLTSLYSFQKLSPIEVKPSRTAALQPLTLITPTNIIHKKWFASAGLTVNNYSNGGIELRGGLKPLYGVVNLGLLNYGRYRLGYGLGTSARITDALSLNVIYNYAQMKSTETRWKHLDNLILEKNYNITMKHNQLKLMLQYDLHPRFSINAGASVNLLNTTHQLKSVLFESKNVSTSISSSSGSEPTYLNSASGSPSFIQQVIPRGPVVAPVLPLEGTYQSNRTWVGWEIGFFYRMNF